MSFVAISVCIAQLWRRTCGVTRFLPIDGCLPTAVATCLARIYSNPERVMARPATVAGMAFRDWCGLDSTPRSYIYISGMYQARQPC